MNDLETYIPSDEEALKTYQEVKTAVAQSKKQNGGLTTRQLAMAIIAGLDIWNSRSDVAAVVEQLEFLSHE